MTARLRLLASLPGVVIALAAGPALGAEPRLKTPSAAELGRAPATIADSTLTAAGVLTVMRSSQWGGEVRAATGETVTVLVSSGYPEDPAVQQRWADFFAGLVHGDELARLTAYFAPLREVQRVCGQDALACYSPGDELLITPGEDPNASVSAESIAMHEYGHHVARNRDNAPWRALDHGTKRWATHVNVCARWRAGELFPGSQSITRYRLNPGEVFAESYRVLNERRAGVPESSWSVVSRDLYPDDRSLQLLELDVVRPWTSTTRRTYRSTFTKRVRMRTFRLSTPLDGSLNVVVRAPKGARVELEVLAGTQRLTRLRTSTGSSRRYVTAVCGARNYALRVRALSGTGTVRLEIDRP